MKGEKGVCSIGLGATQVKRTKFNTKKNAQEACDFHKAYSLVNEDAVIYHCKICGMWHFGKPEWAELYSKI
jgi:rubrerythrin